MGKKRGVSCFTEGKEKKSGDRLAPSEKGKEGWMFAGI